jgi:hypothetical protein
MAEINAVQQQILSALLRVPHRRLGPTVDSLRAAMRDDPNTVAHYCAYLLLNPKGTRIDDLKQAALIVLLSSEYADYREAGAVMLLGNKVYPYTDPTRIPGLPPYQILRVERYMRSKWRVLLGRDLEIERTESWDEALNGQLPPYAQLRPNTGEKPGAFKRRALAARKADIAAETPAKGRKRSAGQERARAIRHQFEYLQRLTNRINGARAAAKEKGESHWSLEAVDANGRPLPFVVTPAMFHVELVPGHVRAPATMKRIMRDYLRALEASPAWFDAVAILNREDLQNAYKLNYIPRGERAQAMLFGTPPADSTFAVIKQIAETEDVYAKARLIMEHNIPDTVAASLLGNSPAAWIARLEIMTPTQVLNATASFEESGVLNIPEVKAAFDAKRDRATGSAARVMGRKSAQSKDTERQARSEQLVEKAIAKSGQMIDYPVAVFFDKSTSTGQTIQYAAQFAGWLAAHIKRENLLVCAFDTITQAIEPREHTLRGYLEAISRIRAGGGTNMAQALEWLANRRFIPQRIVWITDGGENLREDGSGQPTVPVSPGARAHQTLFPGVPVTVFGMGSWLETPANQRLRYGDTGYHQYRQGRWHETFGKDLQDAGLDVTIYLPSSAQDYTLFDQLTSAMGGVNLMQEIIDTPLPRRVAERTPEVDF